VEWIYGTRRVAHGFDRSPSRIRDATPAATMRLFSMRIAAWWMRATVAVEEHAADEGEACRRRRAREVGSERHPTRKQDSYERAVLEAHR
jgi:hypothetical protein